jgi:excinuclease UvrABC nuclease subunit
MGRASNKKRFVRKNVESAPSGPGVYRLYDGPKVSYIGSGRDMGERLSAHLPNPRFRNITSFDTRRTASTREARKSEQRAIDQQKPPQNHT